MVVRIYLQHLSIGTDQFGAEKVVAGQPVARVEPAETAAERKAGDTGLGHDTERHSETVFLGGPIEIAEQQAGSGMCRAFARIDSEVLHRGQVKHDPAVADRAAGDVVAPTANRQRKVVAAGVRDTARHIRHLVTPQDRQRPTVDHAVENRAGRLIPAITRPKYVTLEIRSRLRTQHVPLVIGYARFDAHEECSPACWPRNTPEASCWALVLTGEARPSWPVRKMTLPTITTPSGPNSAIRAAARGCRQRRQSGRKCCRASWSGARPTVSAASPAGTSSRPANGKATSDHFDPTRKALLRRSDVGTPL
jgi:hypothetical protein